MLSTAMTCSDSWQSGKTLSQSAIFMLDNEIATDVTFKYPNTGETVKAHHFVLMARSHVFFVMFNSSLDKPGEDIEISDIQPTIFKEFLRYLYCDETTLSAEKAPQLTYCAEKYEVTDLKAKCTEFLLTQVDETTVAIILDHAVLYNDDAPISTCRDIIKQLETLSCLDEHHITKDTLELVLSFEDLTVRELDIFKFCNTWAENECKRMEIPVHASNKRKMLGPLMKKIPFCSMTHDQFATEVSGKHLLNGQEELQIFRFICAPDKSNPPFPCKTKQETKKPFISVKVPNMKAHKDSTRFRLHIHCSKPYTLLGLGFTQAGNYDIIFRDSHEENFSIQKGNLQGFLGTPVQYKPCVWQPIQSVSPLHDVGDSRAPPSFTLAKHVGGHACPIKLDFWIGGWGKLPFDTLLLAI